MSSSEWQPQQQDPFARVWAELQKVKRDAEQRVNYLLRNAGLRVAEGALHVLQRLVVEGDQEITGSLDVSGDAEFTGDTAIGGTLGVTGETTLGGDTTISGDTDVTGQLGVTGRTTLGGDTSITGDTDVTGDLDVTGRTALGGDTTISGNAAVTGGGSIDVSDGGAVRVNDGGTLEWYDAASRLRLEMRRPPGPDDSANLVYYDATGMARVVVGDIFNSVGDPAGPGILTRDADGSNMLSARPGQSTVSSNGTTWVEAGENVNIVSDGDIWAGAQSGDVTIVAGNSLNIRKSTTHRLYSSGNDLYLTAPTNVGVVDADLYVWGNIGSSGSKNFKIVHPLDPTRALVHASTESPVAGIEYTGTATLNDQGEALVELPDYFEALAAPDSRTVHLTPVGRPFPVGADPVEDGAFTAYGEPGRTVSWLVKARRGDKDGQFEVEPTRDEAGIDPSSDQPHTPEVPS